MKRIVLALFILVHSTFIIAQEVPLIDRELFFDNPEIAGAQISPDGQWMTFVKPHKGTLNVWLKKAGEPFNQARLLTADTTRPVTNYFWTDDSRFVLFLQDKAGDENFHVYAVDPKAKADAATGVPIARDLTPLENARAFIYLVSKKDPTKMWVGLNQRDQAWHDLYQVDIATGERKLLRENTDRITGWVFDWNEDLRLATRALDDGSSEILRVDKNGFSPIYKTSVLEESYPLAFNAENNQVYIITNKDRNFAELSLLDPTSAKETLVERDPLGKVDISDAWINDRTHQLELTTYFDEKPRLYFKNKAWEKDYNFLKSKFPGKEIDLGSMDKSQNLLIISVYSDTDPGEVYLFDHAKQALTFQYRPRPKLDPKNLAPMEPITYKSSDGLEIPAYVTYPKGKTREDLPLMVIPHGGPWARDYWGYNRYAQFWANRGYAVLQMNFRGSTGYGKKFLDAGNGEWGQLMQDDITWGVKYLVDQGIVDPGRVGIYGGSYGGYATLAGVTFTPALYKAAVALVAPSNLNTLLASIPPYWESFRKVMYQRMADPSTPEGKALLESQSPLNHVDKIQTPLMIVQGANDPRVKKAEADQIVVAMREKGIPVEYICASDEGHGFARPVNNMAHLAAAEKFVAKQLGGRYQESMTPEVAKRLQEITVDPKSVTRPRRADEVAAEAIAFKPVRDLESGTFLYKMNIEVSGQNIPMDITRTVRMENGNWVITDMAKSAMMGNITDQNVIAPKTLVPVSRHVEQGPVVIDLNYGKDAITGTMKMNNNPQDIKVEQKEALQADGAGLDLVIGALDLKIGLHSVYKVFDINSQVVKPYEVKVKGQESVTVNAGTFNACWIVEVKELDGNGTTTYWITNGIPVKSSAVLPAMNGAIVTTELQKDKP